MELYAFKRNNFILNKLLPCLIITMFAIMCLYGSSVYATSISVNNETFETSSVFDEYISSSYYSFIYFSNTSNKYTLYISDSPFEANFENDNIYTISNNNLLYYVGPDSNLSNIFNCSTVAVPGSNTFNRSAYLSGIIFSTHNIYDSNHNLVFQAPSQTQATIVASQVGEVEMNKTLQEILGILPVVILVLVGLIAIRKGIIFLIALMKRQ